ncbi:MAG UNVERIFIED_CONTAM: hypothetical protein LVR18_16495 [Planctomycetaceae bacterium]
MLKVCLWWVACRLRLAVDLQQQLTGENPSPWSASSLLLRSVAVSPGQAGFEGALWTLCSPASLSRLQPGTARTAVVIPGTYRVEWQRCLRETQRLVQSGVDQVLLLLTDALRHDGSCTVAAVEELFAGALCRDGLKLRILRLGRVLHPSSSTAALLSCLQATLPAAVSVSCLHLPELVEIIENEVSAGFSNHSRTGSSPVVLSIPGERRSMREAVFAENSKSFGVGWRLLTKLLRGWVSVGCFSCGFEWHRWCCRNFAIVWQQPSVHAFVEIWCVFAIDTLDSRFSSRAAITE